MLNFELNRIPLKANGNKTEVVDLSLTETPSFMYQMPMLFGSNKNKAMINIDMTTSAVMVTSDICNNCETMAYKPGTSQTANSTGTRWQYDL